MAIGNLHRIGKFTYQAKIICFLSTLRSRCGFEFLSKYQKYKKILSIYNAFLISLVRYRSKPWAMLQSNVHLAWIFHLHQLRKYVSHAFNHLPNILHFIFQQQKIPTFLTNFLPLPSVSSSFIHIFIHSTLFIQTRLFFIYRWIKHFSFTFIIRKFVDVNV